MPAPIAEADFEISADVAAAAAAAERALGRLWNLEALLADALRDADDLDRAFRALGNFEALLLPDDLVTLEREPVAEITPTHLCELHRALYSEGGAVRQGQN